MKAIKPKARAIRLGDALEVSIIENSPLSNKVRIIGSERTTKPMMAGNPANRTKRMDQSMVLENSFLLSLWCKDERRGSITVAMAMAKIPRGNCINLSDTYNQEGLPVGKKEASIVSTNMFS